MKNKQFKQLYKLLKTEKSDAGFTLMELLMGLVMSTVVIAGLGLGLYQLTRTTRDESSKMTARNEASRTIEFISDELRRAQSIVVDNSPANIAALAPNYPFLAGGNVRLALDLPGVDERIIYAVAPPQAGSSWNGPLVIYRWGPPFDANGEYTNPDNPGDWQNRALIDDLDNSNQTIPDCNGITSYQGFFACMIDDDDDGIVEDGLTDTNGDGLVNIIDGDGIENDSEDDVDGLTITAQLYFATQIDIDNVYTAETQAVARARDRDTDAALDLDDAILRFKTLAAEYSLGTMGGGAICDGKTTWTMRTEFINDGNLGNAGYSGSGGQPTQWIHDPDRQGQPIKIDTSAPLTIASIPIGYSSCTGPILSRGNEDLGEETYFDEDDFDGDGDKSELHPNYPYEKVSPYTSWTPKAGIESSDFTIDFSDPTTFNGNKEGYPSYDNPDVGVDHVKVYKKGSTIADYDGYDDNDGDGNPGETSLGEFLASKGYAVLDGTSYRLVNDADYAADPTLNILEDNERIIAVEIGQAINGPTIDGVDNPGFDMQDSVFILSTDKFDDEFPASDF